MDTTKDRDKTHEAILLFVEEVVDRLEAFPDAGTMQVFTLFDAPQIN